MKDIRKRRKKIFALILLLVITIGYALISTTLKINGVAGIKSNTWDIHWENVQPNQQSTVTTEKPSITENATKVTYTVNLELPGDFYEFTVDAKNDGSINGIISDIKHSVYLSTDLEHTTTLPSYIKYSIVYDGTEDAPATGDVLDAGEKQTYRIRIEYDSRATVLPGSDTTYIIIDEIDYGQTKKSSDNNYTTDTANTKCANGTMLGENWCYTNPGSTLENQEFQYWINDTTYIKSGWAILEDLYDTDQVYYFENGIAKKGWRNEKGNRYYLSTFDDDGNGYINCNMLKNEKRIIDNVCYNFDAKGVATESTGCSDPSGSYYYATRTASESIELNDHVTTLNSEWPFYLRQNILTNNIDVCGLFENGTVCMTSSYHNSDYSSAGSYNNDYEDVAVDGFVSYTTPSELAATGLKGYTLAKATEMLNKGASSCYMYYSSNVGCYGANGIHCEIQPYGTVYCGSSYSCTDNFDGSSYCR